MTHMTRRHALATLSASPLLFSQSARADEFPARPLRIVVAYAAGGSTDVAARQISVSMSHTLNQSVIVDNRPGGNSAVAVNYAMSQPADGYTMLMTDPSQFVVNPHVYKRLPYDATGFEPVAMVHRFPFILVVRADHPAKTLKDFIAAAKSRPNGINYGSAGSGTPLHLGMEKVIAATGIRATHVPYKGTAPALNDLMAGQVETMFADVGGSLEYVKAGKIRALAVASAARHPLLPGVPTFIESGYPDVQVEAWFGLMVKRGTPQAVVKKLNSAVVTAVADPRVAQWMHSVGATPASLPNTPEDFAKVMKRDSDMWGKVAGELNVSLD